MKKRVSILLFGVYIVFLLLFVILKFDGSFAHIAALYHNMLGNEQHGIKNINLILFQSISPYLRNITEPYAFWNMVGNIVSFLSLGFFVISCTM